MRPRYWPSNNNKHVEIKFIVHDNEQWTVQIAWLRGTSIQTTSWRCNSVLEPNVVDSYFRVLSGQTKNYEKCIYYFSTNHAW